MKSGVSFIHPKNEAPADPHFTLLRVTDMAKVPGLAKWAVNAIAHQADSPFCGGR